MQNSIKNTLLVLSLTMTLISCSKDEKVEPVDIVEANPEIQRMQLEANQAKTEIEKQISEAQKKAEEEAAAMAAKFAEKMEEARREMEAKAEEMEREIQERIRNSQVLIGREQRQVALDLMTTKDVKDHKKIVLAMKYFALMEFQINELNNETELKSVQDFLEDTKGFFPKKLRLKDAMRKDKTFNLYTLALTLNTKNPERDLQVELDSFQDIIVRGLENRDNPTNEADELVAANATKLIFLLQLRHNALYDAVLGAFGALKFKLFGRHKITGKGMSLQTAQFLQRMLIEADQTRGYLHNMEIKISEFKKRRRKLKRLKLKLEKNLDPALEATLRDIHRHIQENY